MCMAHVCLGTIDIGGGIHTYAHARIHNESVAFIVFLYQQVTFRKGISSPSTNNNAEKSDVDDGLHDRFSPSPLSALPFPLGATIIEASVAAAAAAAAEAEAEDGPNIFGQSRIAPSLPFYRRAADGAVSLVGWRGGQGADAEQGGWAGGQAFEWEWTDPSAFSAASGPGEEDGDGPLPGVFAGWGVAPEERLRALGVGGLDGAFRDIFRRVFASRLAPSDLVAEMGLKHVRGVLLYGKWGGFGVYIGYDLYKRIYIYIDKEMGHRHPHTDLHMPHMTGPPGCGKTLLARQIGSLLGTREPKVVNGPEVLGSLVGESEANIRKFSWGVCGGGGTNYVHFSNHDDTC